MQRVLGVVVKRAPPYGWREDLRSSALASIHITLAVATEEQYHAIDTALRLGGQGKAWPLTDAMGLEWR